MIKVWTDGASSAKQDGIGGWAWCAENGWRGYGSEETTTNQRMELQAVLDVVQHIPGDLVVHSDSAYVVNCFLQGWWRGWLKSDFKHGTVKNLDLWKPLIRAVVHRDAGTVSFVKVKGHSGDPMNDLADTLAVQAKKQQLPTTRHRLIRRG
jgi:ribonuclease HI